MDKEIPATLKDLRELLSWIDMQQGTPFNRFNNPDYEVLESDIEEAKERIGGLVRAYAGLAIKFSRTDDEADWLAEMLSTTINEDSSVEDKTSPVRWRAIAKNEVANSRMGRFSRGSNG